MTGIYMGIDPGAAGGIAVIGPDCYYAEAMPYVAKEIDARRVSTLLRQYRPTMVCIEKAQAMPGQGVTSMFNYGKGFGKLLGVLESLGLPHKLVTPQAWKKAVLAGTAKDKDAAILYAMRAYPLIDLMPGKKRKPHDGIADAVCIADYARYSDIGSITAGACHVD